MKILIITYSLPPFGGIGGRRWAKFGRLLKERGHEVKFLSEKKEQGDHAPQWQADHEAIKDSIETFVSAYPKRLMQTPVSLFEKVMYRLDLWRLKRKEKGNYFDRSSQDQMILTAEVERLINEGFTTVIASGAPFIHLYHLALLRKEREDFKLFADLRDPWAGQKYSYGFQTLSEARRKVEQERQDTLVETADGIFTVAARLSEKVATPRSGHSHIHTLHNGYDSAELCARVEPSNDKLTMVYAGNLYEGAMGQMSRLISGLDTLKERAREAYDFIQIDFFGSVPDGFAELISAHPVITHHGRVDLATAHRKISGADLALVLLIDELNYSMSTKFLEYLAYDKPIVLFSKEGDTAQYVIENDIGYFFRPDDFLSKMTEMVRNKKSGQRFSLPASFDKSQFDIERLCDRLVDLLS